MIMSLPDLPDCTACGAAVVVDTDLEEGPVEICVSCDLAQPVPGVWGRAEIRRRVRVVKAQTRRRGLPLMLCPSCKPGRHESCHASGCECPGRHPFRPGVPDAS